MKKVSLKSKMQYKYDNRSTKELTVLLFILILVTLVAIFGMAAVLFFLNLSPDGFGWTVWNSFSAIVNMVIPVHSEGGLDYIVPMAVASLIGVVLTSVLTGIITNIIAANISKLCIGDSKIVEKNHIVILGFEKGAFEIINQMIQAQNGGKACIAVLEDVERKEMEEAIRNNVDIPKGIKIVCRRTDITCVSGLEKASIETCSKVIVNTNDDARTVKAVIAANDILRSADRKEVPIVACVTKDDYLLPPMMMKRNNIIMVQTYSAIAKIITHTCTLPGIADTITDLLNFDGNEIYVGECFKYQNNEEYSSIQSRTENAIPIGFFRKGKAILNPEPHEMFQDGDELIYIAETEGDYKVRRDWSQSIAVAPVKNRILPERQIKKVAVIGFNDCIGTVIDELPSEVETIFLADTDKKKEGRAAAFLEKTTTRKVTFIDFGVVTPDNIDELLKDVKHVIILSSHEKDKEESDLKNMLTFIKMFDAKSRDNLDFNITTEMCFESNRKLIENRDKADFVVSYNLTALMMAQLAYSPKLKTVFDELFTKGGNELLLKSPEEIGSTKDSYKSYELRQMALGLGYTFIGYLEKDKDDTKTILNPPFEADIIMKNVKKVIVIGNDDIVEE